MGTARDPHNTASFRLGRVAVGVVVRSRGSHPDLLVSVINGTEKPVYVDRVSLVSMNGAETSEVVLGPPSPPERIPPSNWAGLQYPIDVDDVPVLDGSSDAQQPARLFASADVRHGAADARSRHIVSDSIVPLGLLRPDEEPLPRPTPRSVAEVVQELRDQGRHVRAQDDIVYIRLQPADELLLDLVPSRVRSFHIEGAASSVQLAIHADTECHVDMTKATADRVRVGAGDPQLRGTRGRRLSLAYEDIPNLTIGDVDCQLLGKSALMVLTLAGLCGLEIQPRGTERNGPENHAKILRIVGGRPYLKGSWRAHELVLEDPAAELDIEELAVSRIVRSLYSGKIQRPVNLHVETHAWATWHSTGCRQVRH